MRFCRIPAWICLVLALILCLSSCADSNSSVSSSSVSLKLEGVSTANTKSLIPDGIPVAANYEVRLSKVEMGADGYEAISEPYSIKTAGGSDTVTIDNVEIGTYSLVIDGLDSAGNAFMTGASDVFNVTPDGNNTVTVQMNLISEGVDKTGSAKVVFDWASIAESNETIKEAMANGGLKFSLYYVKDGKYVLADQMEEGTGTSATRYEYIVDGLPVSTGLVLRYDLSTSTGVVLKTAIHLTTAQIYANLISVPDVNEDSIVYIKDSDISSVVNVTDVNWEYIDDGESAGTSAIRVSWNNQFANGEPLFERVFVTCTPSSGEPIVEEVTVGSEETSSCKFTLAEGGQYTITIQAKHLTGLVSDIYTIDETITGKVPVTGISILKDGEEVENVSITRDESVAFTVRFTPDNASVQTVKWDGGKVLTSDGNGSFTPKELGQSTVIATSDDNGDAFDSVTVSVVLSAPEWESIEKTADSIELKWTASTDAASYKILRSVDSGEYKEIGTSETNSYSDKAVSTGEEYRYKVQALNTALNSGDYVADSAESEVSEPVMITNGSVVVIQPEPIDNDLVVSIVGGGELILGAEDESLTLRFDGSSLGEGFTQYEWFVDINATPVKSGAPDESNSTFINITRDMEGLTQGEINGTHTLMLRVLYNGKWYSDTITFAIFDQSDAIATGVEYTIDEGNVLRLSTTDSEGNPRTVHINAQATGGSYTDVVFTSSNPDIATVDEDGLVKFVGTDGEVSITISPAFNDSPEASQTITFDVYQPTITSAEQLLEAVNDYLKNELQTVNSLETVNGDWFCGPTNLWYDGVEEWVYPNSEAVEFVIQCCTPLSSSVSQQVPGYISFTNKKIDEYIVNGRIDVFARYENESGYLGVDRLEYVGYGDNKEITINLPYNQGTAHIVYDINVIENTGTYTVTFDSSVGTDCYNADENAFHGGSTPIANDESRDLL